MSFNVKQVEKLREGLSIAFNGRIQSESLFFPNAYRVAMKAFEEYYGNNITIILLKYLDAMSELEPKIMKMYPTWSTAENLKKMKESRLQIKPSMRFCIDFSKRIGKKPTLTQEQIMMTILQVVRTFGDLKERELVKIYESIKVDGVDFIDVEALLERKDVQEYNLRNQQHYLGLALARIFRFHPF